MTNKQNQSCWNCALFQLYDDQATPEGVSGECRKEPIVGWRYNVDWFDRYTPFIGDGREFWCSKWKLTALTPPPKPVGTIVYLWPEIWWNWVPWNVREPLNQSCLNCNHFQENGFFESGECRKYSPPTVVDYVFGTADDILPGTPYQYYGDTWWCGCWEVQQTPDVED